MIERTCKYCQRAFAANAGRQLYCSTECRRGAHSDGLFAEKQKTPDPTPEELAERIKEVQAKWDEATRRKRAGLPSEPEPYEVPTVSTEFLEPNNKQAEE